MSATELSSRRRGSRFAFALALVAALSAVVIYWGWRRGLWINRLAFGLDAPLVRFAAGHPLPRWVRFSLPDALWQYAFCAALLGIWRGEPWHWKKLAWVAAPFVIGSLVELGQAAHLVPGTFDWGDLGAGTGAVAVALVLHAR